MKKVKVGGNVQFNPGWHMAMDLNNMLDISEAVTRAALERTESRGAHTREDHPNTEKEWGKVNLTVNKRGGAVVVERVPLQAPPADMQALIDT